MSEPRPLLRRRLLLLLVTVGGVGLGTFLLLLHYVDERLFHEYLPETRALREVESRAGQLLQNYFRFMLTPDLIDAEVLDDSVVLIRERLDAYRDLVAGDRSKEELAQSIDASIDELQQAGQNLVVARRQYDQIEVLQETLEDDIERGFARYREEVSRDIGKTVETREWEQLARKYLPELRMIDSIHQDYLRLSVELRQTQSSVESDTAEDIAEISARIRRSSAMLELYEENSGDRQWISTSLLVIFERMREIVTRYEQVRQQADFALSLAEQRGIDLRQAVGEAISISEIKGWDRSHDSLILSGAVMLLTLGLSYLILFIGLDRAIKPLGELQVLATRFTTGDLSGRADTSRDDEIGQLAVAFNGMADELEQHRARQQTLIEQLEQKNTELERFTYTVSHELKTPLVTVSGFIGLLQRDLEDGNRERMLDDMEKISVATATMSNQLEDLLELSRIGRSANPSSRFSISAVCTEIVDMLRGTIEVQGAEVGFDADLPQVYADRERVREVLKNLVENGIKFAATVGTPKVQIGAMLDGDRVLCRVEDNGPGIEPRYHEQVFGLFDRLDTNVPGTGIGLALVRRIVETHHGDIWIESQGDGQGCSFCFTLPQSRGN